MTVAEKGVLQNKTEERSRNYGIDLARLFCMFLVVMCHILETGGVLEASVGRKSTVSWLLHVLPYCAVDCYALISGYVSFSEKEKPLRLNKYINLWLQVAFYSFFITFGAYFLKPEAIGIKGLVMSLFPVSTYQYWYFSAYTVVFLFSPWLNNFVRKSEKDSLSKFILVAFILFSVLNIFSVNLGFYDPFRLEDGFSAIWLVFLYIVGSWLKKSNFLAEIKSKLKLLILVTLILLLWLFKVLFPNSSVAKSFLNYTSPFVLIMSVLMLLLFSEIKIKGVAKKLIMILSPAAFGVYLIHFQPLIKAHFLSNGFVWVTRYPTWLFPFVLIGCAFAVYIVCLIIELIRIQVFKLVRVDWLVNACVKKLKRLFSKIF